MSAPYLTLALSLATLVLVIVFAQWSRARTKAKLEKTDAPKSSLAKDGPGPQPFR